jgi:hypothetical protein
MTFNGYKNWETWNVALWISNDQRLYNIAKDCNNYSEFLEYMDQDSTNGDGVNYRDPILDIEELDEVIFETE